MIGAFFYSQKVFHFEEIPSHKIPHYVLSDFASLQLLDDGGQANIFSGRLHDFGQIVLKQFKRPWDECKQEIEILIEHRHPNIVYLYGVLRNDSDTYISGYVMEYAVEGNIHDQEQSYDLTQIFVWIEQIARGLHFLHRHEIIHKDIKPKNILMYGAGKLLKLADFGTAKNPNDFTTSGRGTAPYMAPEAILGHSKLSSDIYSLAITIWEIFHRRRPYYEFTETAGFALQHKIIEGARPTMEPDKIDENVAALIESCWQKNVEDRPEIRKILDLFESKSHCSTPSKVSPSYEHGESADATLTNSMEGKEIESSFLQQQQKNKIHSDPDYFEIVGSSPPNQINDRATEFLSEGDNALDTIVTDENELEKGIKDAPQMPISPPPANVSNRLSFLPWQPVRLDDIQTIERSNRVDMNEIQEFVVHATERTEIIKNDASFEAQVPTAITQAVAMEIQPDRHPSEEARSSSQPQMNTNDDMLESGTQNLMTWEFVEKEVDRLDAKGPKLTEGEISYYGELCSMVEHIRQAHTTPFVMIPIEEMETEVVQDNVQPSSTRTTLFPADLLVLNESRLMELPLELPEWPNGHGTIYRDGPCINSYMSAVVLPQSLSENFVKKAVTDVNELYLKTNETSIIGAEIPPNLIEHYKAEDFDSQTILALGGRDENVRNELLLLKKAKWTELSLQLPKMSANHGTVYFKGVIYIFGGDLGNRLYKMDKRLKWIRLADMHQQRHYITNSCLEWKGRIWIFGGSDVRQMETLKTVERYDPEENKWTAMPDMKHARIRASVTAWNRKFIICGGLCGRALLASAECFDPESGVWTEWNSLPTPLYGHTLITYRNDLILIGGFNEENQCNTVLEFSKFGGKYIWKKLPSLKFRRGNFSAVILNDEIHIIGGYGGVYHDESEIFNGTSWRDGSDLPRVNCDMSAVVIPQAFADVLYDCRK